MCQNCRQDEAEAPTEGGYTLLEAAVLTRSSVPGQRAAGLRLIAAVLDQVSLAALLARQLLPTLLGKLTARWQPLAAAL